LDGLKVNLTPADPERTFDHLAPARPKPGRSEMVLFAGDAYPVCQRLDVTQGRGQRRIEGVIEVPLPTPPARFGWPGKPANPRLRVGFSALFRLPDPTNTLSLN
jgi:hypothetical protein